MKPVFYVTFAFSFSLVFFSCGSTPKSELQAENHLEGQYSAQPSEAVSIALPPKKEKNFFQEFQKKRSMLLRTALQNL